MRRNRDLEAHGELLTLRAAVQGGDAEPEEHLLLRGLGQLYPEEPPPSVSSAGWESLAGEARRAARSRRRGYLLGEFWRSLGARRWVALAAVPAALLLAVGLRGRAGRVSASPTVQLVVAAHTELVAAPSETKEVRLSSGAELRLLRGAATVEQGDQRRTQVVLGAGAVALRVPPLPSGSKMVVTTADAEVIVHGTRFRVRKDAADATEVEVDEGLVEVRPLGGGRPAVFLRPGERVRVPSLPSYVGGLSRKVDALVASRRCTDPEGSLDTYLRIAPQGSDISEAQYLKGYCLVEQGRADDALAYFEQAADSADPTRADNALARAAQLLAGRDPARGKAAWGQYLHRFPQGHHRALAERALMQ